MGNNPHISEYPIGTVIPLRRKGKRQTAVLHSRGYHSEEWRIYVGAEPGRGYVYSEGYRYVVEHSVAP